MIDDFYPKPLWWTDEHSELQALHPIHCSILISYLWFPNFTRLNGEFDFFYFLVH